MTPPLSSPQADHELLAAPRQEAHRRGSQTASVSDFLIKSMCSPIADAAAGPSFLRIASRISLCLLCASCKIASRTWGSPLAYRS
jgi:hypothetical protein